MNAIKTHVEQTLTVRMFRAISPAHACLVIQNTTVKTAQVSTYQEFCFNFMAYLRTTK